MTNLAGASTPTLTIEPGATLKAIQEEDAQQGYVDGLNDPEVSSYLITPNKGNETLETVRSFVRACWDSPSDLLIGLFVNQGHRGNVRLHDIDDKSAWIGIALFDRSVWGQGWAVRSLTTVCDYAAEELNLEKIYAGVDTRNDRSVKTFTNAGFKPCEIENHKPRGDFDQVWVLQK
ncbi:MAG: GNAT family N-acetyltransferase [Rhodospirillales bacterium]|nr:GNAT family N-acetyltransferase [Rhodospirillales bacterium]